ncbi:MAG: calcium/sodium antiporter [Flavobacteriales bacterium]|nr:calcium/sodium antiporter [Flavobacteriales bacterium]
MLTHVLFLFLGLVLLVKGADWLVSGGSATARRLRMSELAIGLTIVAFGTSAPELVVNVIAASDGLPAIVYGNIIGSNNFNLFVILGLAGIISPLAVQRSTVWAEIPISLLAILVLAVLSGTLHLGGIDVLSRTDALIMLLLFAGFLVYVARSLKAAPGDEGEVGPLKSWTWTIGLTAAGLAGLILGGRLVVDHAVSMATTLGVSKEVIGLTIVAAGTSLPELATSMVAAVRRNTDIAIGNVVGSNIFNVLLIMPISAMVRPISYDPVFLRDMVWCAAGTLFLFGAMFLGKRQVLQRWQAAGLVMAYVLYTAMLIG